MKGTIIRRGKSSWRIKFDVGLDARGKRKIRYQTIRGKRADADRELAKAVSAFHDGTSVEPAKITVAEYVRSWLEKGVGKKGPLAPKTLERFKQLAEQQIIPHLGASALQKLRPLQIEEWHATLLKSGGAGGRPLSARTVVHSHRLLHSILAHAMAVEIISRNVASVISPPRVEGEEVQILSPSEIGRLLTGLANDKRVNRVIPINPVVVVGLATGLRRGELLGLKWGDIDLDGAFLKVERSVEETRAGLRLKLPKTKFSRRTLSLPASAVTVLRAHRTAQRELRVALGLGRETPTTLVFSRTNGALLSPESISKSWMKLAKSLGLTGRTLHSIRHTHASALIAAGLDVVTVSRRLGHASPTVTLTVYAHLFQNTDVAAATAIEAAMKGGSVLN